MDGTGNAADNTAMNAAELSARSSAGVAVRSALKPNRSNQQPRQITWNDTHGKDLTEVHEFEPSDGEEEEEEDYLERPACCVIA